MASVAFGSTVAAAAPASSSAAGRGRPRRSVLAVPAATRAGRAPAAKEETSLAEFIFGKIFKKDQLVETDPLLNKVDGAPATAASRAKTRAGTTSGGKKPASSDDGGSGGGFSLGGFFDKKA